jgi:DNA-binding Lrp family transcriptional regulator
MLTIKTRVKVLSRLDGPSTVSDLSRSLGISRQRLSVILSALEKSGHVRRYKTAGSCWLYVKEAEKNGRRRQVKPPSGSSPLIVYLDHRHPTSESALISVYGAANYRREIDVLIKTSQVEKIEIGRKRYFILKTPASEPPHRKTNRIPAPRSDIVKVFGRVRAHFLVAFLENGRMSSREIRAVLPENLLEDRHYSYRHVIQRLKSYGYINGDRQSGHAKYELSEHGRDVSLILKSYWPAAEPLAPRRRKTSSNAHKPPEPGPESRHLHA